MGQKKSGNAREGEWGIESRDRNRAGAEGTGHTGMGYGTRGAYMEREAAGCRTQDTGMDWGHQDGTWDTGMGHEKLTWNMRHQDTGHKTMGWDKRHEGGTRGLGMEHKVTGRDTRHWDGMGGAGMGQKPLGRDMRKDSRSQEETVQEDMEYQDGTGGPGMGHKVTAGDMG